MKYLCAILFVASVALAKDNLDSTKGAGWSPDGRWLAFNPIKSDNLLVVTLNGQRNFLLKPVGAISVDSATVFSAGVATNRSTAKVGATDDITLELGSPGRSKLEALGWSPTGGFLAYKYSRQDRAVFSAIDQAITRMVPLTEALPWEKPDDYRVAFEFERASTNHATRYALRVVRPDASVVKELFFDNPRELQRLSLLRNTGSTFLTPDNRRLIYPKYSEAGWQLVTHEVAGNAAPQPLTVAAPAAPYEWKLSPDGQTLAVVENSASLAIGPLDNWASATRVALSNLTLSVEWSPDGRYLAGYERLQLYLLEIAPDTHRPVGELTPVYDSCSMQFRGWRGQRLIFGDAKANSADLFVVDPAIGRKVEPLVKAKNWRSAPSVRTIAPDGNTFVVLVSEIGGEGRLVHELWKIKLAPGNDWEFLCRLPAGYFQ